MRFALDDEQVALRDALDKLVAGNRAAPDLWQRLEELGINDLAAEASAVEVVVAFEVLGKHAVRDAVASTAGVRDDAELATLATAAYLLGAGERVLADTVAYAKQRRQFGREIGSYQAIKHRLADVRIALDFARPLVHGAALDMTPRSVSAAKVGAGDAAYLASRTGLQVHGAIGYTLELELSTWLTTIRELQSAHGTAAFHRRRILDALLAERAG
ncbi:acyl-CoA dehydrogenase family protein [Nocardioides panacisoli]|uniref:Acyl-CoA dehydrogenase/oxidase C-terminal domain-containing protein n=1 Tax=Nocardioides panacisoli TaxID=627624 RepID=A0ABP7J3X5_9ACTN